MRWSDNMAKTMGEQPGSLGGARGSTGVLLGLDVHECSSRIGIRAGSEKAVDGREEVERCRARLGIGSGSCPYGEGGVDLHGLDVGVVHRSPPGLLLVIRSIILSFHLARFAFTSLVLHGDHLCMKQIVMASVPERDGPRFIALCQSSSRLGLKEVMGVCLGLL